MYWWDEKKRTFNLAKHGIDFRDAEKIFDGPLVAVEDTREGGSAIRLISIRKTLKHETRFFFSQIGK